MINCVIIDDEPIARNIIARYIHKTPGLRLYAQFDNALEALDICKTNTIDLLFLDINMPELTGMELLKALNHPPKVIITTAYSEYGAESYEYNVCDYLMKPISFERFLKAINKTELQLTSSNEEQTNVPSEFMFIKTDDSVQKIIKQEVVMVKSYGNYIKLYTSEQEYISRSTLSKIANQLHGFVIQVHKSSLVSPMCIKHIKGNEAVLDNDEVVKIGNSYRLQVTEELSKYSR